MGADMNAAPVTIFWFRRDLRIDDNHGLLQALRTRSSVVPIFIFDTDILDELPRDDARVSFIHAELKFLNHELKSAGSALSVYHGRPREIFAELLREHTVSAVFCNEDYEPYAIKRDAEIRDLLAAKGIVFQAFKDQVRFAKDEIVRKEGEPYRMFTPYFRRWMAEFESHRIPSYTSRREMTPLPPSWMVRAVPELKDIGFKPSKIPLPELRMHGSVLKRYAAERDFPAAGAAAHAGAHLRFGTISVRQAMRAAEKISPAWLRELVWREFFSQLLYHFPKTVNEPFDQRFKKFPWRKSPADLERWKNGDTGYPLVDAGMRELHATGYMHNRVRMVTASFLTKHLLIDWREGERHFAAKLYDFELASNVGNWQWVAGCGCDAAPFFRIFNPAIQAKKFDPQGEYVRKWVPEHGTSKYPKPMVEHEFARRRALAAYEKIKARKK